ncbi:MAG: hypothetical protein ACRDLR_04785, partial [Gaiellaceae bacterium]
MPVNRALVRVLTVIACLGWAIVVVADIHGTGSTDLTAGRLGLRTGEAAMLALALFAVGPPASAGRRFAAATLGISAGAALLAWTVDFLHGFANLCV